LNGILKFEGVSWISELIIFERKGLNDMFDPSTGWFETGSE
jgi:hypothetical protein